MNRMFKVKLLTFFISVAMLSQISAQNLRPNILLIVWKIIAPTWDVMAMI